MNSEDFKELPGHVSPNLELKESGDSRGSGNKTRVNNSVSDPVFSTSTLGFSGEKFTASEGSRSLAGIPPLYLNLREEKMSFYLLYVLVNTHNFMGTRLSHTS